MYEIYLMRHGRSLADDEEKCEGRYDSPLTDVGRQQAQETARRFRDSVALDKIICSPLKRALETARIINEQYDVQLVEDPLWMEIDNGIMAGMPLQEVGTKYPLPAFYSPYRYFPENTGENIVQLHARASLAVNGLIDNGPGKYLVVSHGNILNAALRGILGSPIPVSYSGVYFGFGDNSYAYLKYYEENHKWVLKGFEELA
jgi:2,3-bisphosphoglycerate-dependent phosphoglycerate mutase